MAGPTKDDIIKMLKKAGKLPTNASKTSNEDLMDLLPAKDLEGWCKDNGVRGYSTKATKAELVKWMASGCKPASEADAKPAAKPAAAKKAAAKPAAKKATSSKK